MLSQIKLIHQAGYTYNDMKLDNIMVGFPKSIRGHEDFLHQIRMIDFGLAQKYITDSGKHIQAKKERFFQGNLIFASQHCFNLLTHSRRDDLISLAYLMLYLIDGDLAYLTKDGGDSGENESQFNQAEFQRIKELKNNLTPKDLCESPEALTLLPFIEEVFKYEFDQTPNYDKLRDILLTCLANVGQKEDRLLDWNEQYERNKPMQKPALLDLKKVQAETDLLDDCKMENFDQMNSYQFVADAMKRVQAEANKEDIIMHETFTGLMDLDLNKQQSPTQA